MTHTTRDGITLAYEMDAGEGGPPVVFLQGIGMGRWCWRWQRTALARDVIAPDTRGTGGSDAGLPPLVGRLPGPLRRRLTRGPASYSLAGLGADLEAVLDEAGCRRCHLVGLGVGGLIALEHACEYSRAESVTVVGATHGGVDAAPIPDEAWAGLLATTGSNRRERVRARTRWLFSERFVNRNPHLLDRLLEWRLAADAPDPVLEALIGAVNGADLADRLRTLRVPTVVLHGGADRIVPPINARLLAETIPDAHLAIVDGAGHCLPVERPDRVTAALETVIGGHGGRTRSGPRASY